MSAHLSDRELDRYRERQMPPAELLAANDHLATCEACSRRYDREEEWLAAAYDFVRADLQAVESEELASWRWPVSRIPLQIAATVAVAALGAWLAALPPRARVADLQAQLSRLQEPPAELPPSSKSARSSVPIDTPTPAPRIVLTLADGGRRITLDEQGNLHGLPPLPPKYEQAVRAALTTRRLQLPPILATLAGASVTLRGSAQEPSAFKLLSPTGTVVLSDRPTFRWEPLAGATSYTVLVVDSDFNEVATSQALTREEWTVPHALKRGEVYSWQVTAIKDGQEIVAPLPTAPEARFKILEESKATELTHLEESAPNSHLTLAIFYAASGLVDQARRELRVLSESNPGSSLAESLQRSLEARPR